jgi:hypothetical protein
MRGADGSDSIVVEKVGGRGSFCPIKFDVGLSAEAKSVDGKFRFRFRMRNEEEKKRTSNKK